MAYVRDGFDELECHRLQLENNVAKLRASIRHWQTWEAEYEGLKEEIHQLGEQHTAAELTHLGDDFGGKLLNDKEIKLLFSDANGRLRDSNQIIGLLSRRVDYVQENIKTIGGQLEKAKEKLILSEHVGRPEARDEEGLPMTDIREELDEEGNVISGIATVAADTAPRIVETLRKAGVAGLPDTSKRKRPTLEPDYRIEENDQEDKAQRDLSESLNVHTPQEPTQMKEFKENQNLASTSKSTTSYAGKTDASPLKRKKSVSFAEGTKTEDSKISRKRQPNPIFAKKREPPAIATAETVLDVQHKTPQEQLTALLNAEANLMGGTSSYDSDVEITSPVIPDNESPENAALRRQMLQYNMQEVGAVVAEIELDGDASTPPYSEDEDEYDYDNSSVNEEEDEHGRTTNIMISDEYIKQMKNLEKRLSASMIENIGPNTSSEPSLMLQKEKLSDPTANQGKSTTSGSKGSSTRGVRFAEELDVQEAPIIQDQSTLLSLHSVPSQDPGSRASAPTKSKVSRFKGARKTEARLQHEDGRSHTSETQEPSQPVRNVIIERSISTISNSSPSKLFTTTVPEERTPDTSVGPSDRPHTDTIIERPLPSLPDEPPQEPNELDHELLQQQVMTEYHRQRNRMIYRQGGFLPTEETEEAEVPVDEHGNQEGRKISRFKAARLGRR